jgi:polysaccharide biosynthesis protein PslA
VRVVSPYIEGQPVLERPALVLPAARPQSGLGLRMIGDWPTIPERSASRVMRMFLKRALDIVLSASALILLAPILAAIVIAIKTTSAGPIFFKQARHGAGGRSFVIYKFRTMRADDGAVDSTEQATIDDQRVTALGRFLRRRSLDELPQLINVLRGEMSIVGPRPHPFGMLAGGVAYEDLVAYYHLRHSMRPGISGWAQANGYRGPTRDAAVARARIDHDLAYVQNFSILLDLKIILMTIRREFLSGSGF